MARLWVISTFTDDNVLLGDENDIFLKAIQWNIADFQSNLHACKLFWGKKAPKIIYICISKTSKQKK